MVDGDGCERGLLGRLSDSELCNLVILWWCNSRDPDRNIAGGRVFFTTRPFLRCEGGVVQHVGIERIFYSSKKKLKPQVLQ